MKTLKEFFTGRSNNVTDKLNYRNRNTNVSANESWYQCPMKCEGDKIYNKPGNCPECNMKLVPVNTNSQTAHNHNHHGCC
jgi:Cu2+-exporting ATPase